MYVQEIVDHLKRGYELKTSEVKDTLSVYADNGLYIKFLFKLQGDLDALYNALENDILEAEERLQEAAAYCES